MAFKSYRREVEREIGQRLKRKNEAAAVVVEGSAKKHTPVGTPESTGDPNYKGGRLRSNITHDSSESGFSVGVDVSYAKFVHMGTYSMNMKDFYDLDSDVLAEGLAIVAEAERRQGANGKGMSPRPFLVKGLMDSVGALKGIYSG